MIPEPLMRGTDIIGRPVVDAESGDDVAEIRDLVFNPAQGDLVGFTLNGRGAFAGELGRVLPLDGIASVGTDAVMVAGTKALSAANGSAGEELAAARAADEEVGKDVVVTESGRTLGKVRDIIVRGGHSPLVVAFEIDGGDVGAGLVPLSAQRGVSASALIVPDEFESRIQHDLTGLASELAEIAKSTTDAFDDGNTP